MIICLTGDIYPTRSLAGAPGSARGVFQLLHEADLSIGNFEIPLTARGTPLHKLLTIRADPALAAEVPQIGVDIVTLANNHAGDYGWEGLRDTCAGLQAAGISVIGAGVTRDAAAAPVVHDVAGTKVGVIAFSCLTPCGIGAAADRPGISGLHVRTGYEVDPWHQMEEPGDPSVVRIRTSVMPEDLDYAAASVAALRARCDVLIVTLHWGFGSGEDIAEYQMPLARTLIDAGADVIHGHHPHAIHAVGYYRGKPILFSASTLLGQQVFLSASPRIQDLWAGMSPDAYVAALAFEGSSLRGMTLHPTTLDHDRLPRFTTVSETARIAAHLQRLSAPYGAHVHIAGAVLQVGPATAPSH